MLPILTGLDFSNRSTTDAESIGNRLMWTACGKYLNRLLMCQLGPVVLFPAFLRAVAVLVMDVVEVAIPSHVLETVIQKVAVVVASLLAFFRGAYKREQDEAMQVTACVLARHAQIDVSASVAVLSNLQDAAGKFPLPSGFGLLNARARTNAPRIGDFVEAFKIWHCNPSFHVHDVRSMGLNCNDKHLPMLGMT